MALGLSSLKFSICVHLKVFQRSIVVLPNFPQHPSHGIYTSATAPRNSHPVLAFSSVRAGRCLYFKHLEDPVTHSPRHKLIFALTIPPVKRHCSALTFPFMNPSVRRLTKEAIILSEHNALSVTHINILSE